MGAYGEQHYATVEMKELFDAFRRINAKEREKLFKEAGQLNW